MDDVIKFIEQIFKDSKGKASSKRVITFIVFFLVCIAFILNLFLSIPMEEFIFNGMVMIVGGGLGFNVVEHFAHGSTGKANNTAPTEGKVENPELLEGR